MVAVATSGLAFGGAVVAVATCAEGRVTGDAGTEAAVVVGEGVMIIEPGCGGTVDREDVDSGAGDNGDVVVAEAVVAVVPVAGLSTIVPVALPVEAVVAVSAPGAGGRG